MDEGPGKGALPKPALFLVCSIGLQQGESKLFSSKMEETAEPHREQRARPGPPFMNFMMHLRKGVTLGAVSPSSLSVRCGHRDLKKKHANKCELRDYRTVHLGGRVYGLGENPWPAFHTFVPESVCEGVVRGKNFQHGEKVKLISIGTASYRKAANKTN